MSINGLIYSSIIHTNVLIQEYLEFEQETFISKKMREVPIFYNIYLRTDKFMIYKRKYDIIPKRKKIKFKDVSNLNLKEHIYATKYCKLLRYMTKDNDDFWNMPYSLCFSEIF
jgi:hypothetical protein